MTARTSRVVAGESDTVIVNSVFLAQINFSLARNFLIYTLRPMGRLHKIASLFTVALETGLGDFRTGLEWAVDQLRVILRGKRYTAKQQERHRESERF